jgi:hypothetical protein
MRTRRRHNTCRLHVKPARHLAHSTTPGYSATPRRHSSSRQQMTTHLGIATYTLVFRPLSLLRHLFTNALAPRDHASAHQHGGTTSTCRRHVCTTPASSARHIGHRNTTGDTSTLSAIATHLDNARLGITYALAPCQHALAPCQHALAPCQHALAPHVNTPWHSPHASTPCPHVLAPHQQHTGHRLFSLRFRVWRSLFGTASAVLNTLSHCPQHASHVRSMSGHRPQHVSHVRSTSRTSAACPATVRNTSRTSAACPTTVRSTFR